MPMALVLLLIVGDRLVFAEAPNPVQGGPVVVATTGGRNNILDPIWTFGEATPPGYPNKTTVYVKAQDHTPGASYVWQIVGGAEYATFWNGSWELVTGTAHYADVFAVSPSPEHAVQVRYVKNGTPSNNAHITVKTAEDLRLKKHEHFSNALGREYVSQAIYRIYDNNNRAFPKIDIGINESFGQEWHQDYFVDIDNDGSADSFTNWDKPSPYGDIFPTTAVKDTMGPPPPGWRDSSGQLRWPDAFTPTRSKGTYGGVKIAHHSLNIWVGSQHIERGVLVTEVRQQFYQNHAQHERPGGGF
jgi:hypothetical protein